MYCRPSRRGYIRLQSLVAIRGKREPEREICFDGPGWRDVAHTFGFAARLLVLCVVEAVYQGAVMVLSALDPRVQRCGFCKLEGEGLDFTCKRYEITLGRRSKTPIDVELGASSESVQLCELGTFVCVSAQACCALTGDNHTISRTHAEIKHNFERSKPVSA